MAWVSPLPYQGKLKKGRGVFDDKKKKKRPRGAPKGVLSGPSTPVNSKPPPGLLKAERTNKLASRGHWQSTPTALAALKNR